MDLHVEVTEVVFMRDCVDTWHPGHGLSLCQTPVSVSIIRLSHKPFCLFYDALGECHSAREDREGPLSEYVLLISAAERGSLDDRRCS